MGSTVIMRKIDNITNIPNMFFFVLQKKKIYFPHEILNSILQTCAHCNKTVYVAFAFRSLNSLSAMRINKMVEFALIYEMVGEQTFRTESQWV